MPWLLELGADQVDVLRRVEEAVRGAVQRDEALAARDVIEQRLLLLRADLGRGWRRSAGRRTRPSVFGVQVVELVGVGQLDAALGEHRLQIC